MLTQLEYQSKYRTLLPVWRSGGVEAVGRKRDIEIKPLAARDNRLGTGGSSKPAVEAQNTNKVGGGACRHHSDAAGVCMPIYHLQFTSVHCFPQMRCSRA